MLISGLIIGYICCCALSYYILKDAWTFDLNFTNKDVPIHVFLSIYGPVSFVVSLIIWVMKYLEHKPNPNLETKILKKKKQNV